MTKTTLFSVTAALLISLTTITATAQKLVSSKTHFKFFSTTPAEDIEANNYKTVSTIETSTGEIVFSVPMQSFEFKKSLMQEHFNTLPVHNNDVPIKRHRFRAKTRKLRVITRETSI